MRIQNQPTFVLTLLGLQACPAGCSVDIADPFVLYQAKNRLISDDFPLLTCRPYIRRSVADFKADGDFVEDRYRRYLPILAERLNALQQRDYPPEFWRKYLGMGLVRHITFHYEIFKICGAYLSPDLQTFRVLSPSNYCVPASFEDGRGYFQNTDKGWEQLFAEYCRAMYPDRYAKAALLPVLSEVKGGGNQASRWQLLKEAAYQVTFYSLWVRLVKALFRCYRQPTVALYNVYFSPFAFLGLALASAGRVNEIKVPACTFPADDPLDTAMRVKLSQPIVDGDAFDVFFFQSLENTFPKDCLERFAQIERHCQQEVARYPQIKYIVSEAWLSDALTNALLSFFSLKGVAHLYNEHNALFHPVLGSNYRYTVPLVDKVLTLGWSPKGGAEKIVPVGSLFEWVRKGKEQQDIDILYVTSLAPARREEYNSAYAQSAEAAPGYFKFVSDFLDALDEDTVSSISYKGYPPGTAKQYLCYHMEDFIGNWLARMNILDPGRPAKQYILRSRLVVVDYIATTYLECLHMNVPCVFFLNQSAYCLNEEYADFFELLIDIGMCQTDPLAAAKFVMEIRDDPEQWWQSKPVQAGRLAFLEKNFKSPAQAMDYFCKLAKA